MQGLLYKGNIFHRVIKGFMALSADSTQRIGLKRRDGWKFEFKWKALSDLKFIIFSNMVNGYNAAKMAPYYQNKTKHNYINSND